MTPYVIPYLTAGRNTNQRISKGTWENVVIGWDVRDSHNIDYKPASGGFQLIAGWTYHFTVQLGWEGKDPGWYAFGLFNDTTGERVGPLAEALSPNAGTSNASGGLLSVIYTPDEDGAYVIRMAPGVKAGPSSSIRANVSTILNIVRVDDDFRRAERSTSQTIPQGKTWANEDIRMNQSTGKFYTGIDYDNDTGIFSLKDSTVAYRITAQLGWEGKDPGWYAFGLYDINGNQFGPLAESLSPNRNTSNASGGILDVILVPSWFGMYTPETKYRLKIAPNVTAGSSSKIRADTSTFLNIVQIPGDKSYLFTKCLADQVYNTWKNKTIRMNIINQYGDIIYYPNNGVFTLPGEKRYRITAQLGWEATTPEFYQFGIFNANTGKQLGPLAESLPPNRNTSNASGGVIDVIFTTPASGGEYCLRLSPNMTASSSSKIRADVSTYMIIVEL
jgi:hypothetical protein